MKVTTFLLLSFLCVFISKAQVGVNTDDPKATLDLTIDSPSTPNATDGMLIPRISSFPAIDPTDEQDGMMVFKTSSSPTEPKGFYYWSSTSDTWIYFETEWKAGKDSNDLPLIRASRAALNSNEIVITNTGDLGIGTEEPDAPLHVLSTTAVVTEIIVENSVDKVGLVLKPGNTGHDFNIIANDDATNGLDITDNGVSSLQLENDGDLIVKRGDIKVNNYNSTNNTTLEYPATVYVESDGTLFVSGTRSPIDDLVVNTTSLTSDTISILKDDNEVTDETAALHTYTDTPTQDILLEASYYVAVELNQTEDPTKGPDNQHGAGLFGAFIEVTEDDGGTITVTKYAISSSNYTSSPNEGYAGPYHVFATNYIPLTAGNDYTIELIGFATSPKSNGKGWQVIFANSGDSRVQYTEHK